MPHVHAAEAAVRDHDRRQHRRRDLVRRSRRLRSREPRPRRTAPRRQGDDGRSRGMGRRQARLRHRAGRGARLGASEPVASGEAQQAPRSVRGGRGRVAGAQLRPREHHVHVERRGLAHHRPAHQRAGGRGGARPRQPDTRRAARPLDHLHPLTRRPLRRRVRGDVAGGGRSGRCSHHRPGGLLGRGDRRVRDRGSDHGTSSAVPVRAAAPARSARPRRLRSGLDDGDGAQ